MDQLTVQQLFDTMCDGLDVHWVAGQSGQHRTLSRDGDANSRPNLLGPMNANLPSRIQLLGPTELTLLERALHQDSVANASPASQQEHLALLFSDDCDLIMLTDGQQADETLRSFADNSAIPLLEAHASYIDCINALRYRLTRALAERSVIHGVLMDVLGTGVLITGESGVGKSELALELVSRGHILVADDAPEFRRIAPDTLEGRCPTLLQDFLEVRGLGILNIARMYGDAHTRPRKILKFIIELRAMDPEELGDSFDRSSEQSRERNILGVSIRERTVPVAPGRNLAVLVEAAVRNYILNRTGYNATTDLMNKQTSEIAKN